MTISTRTIGCGSAALTATGDQYADMSPVNR